MGIKCAACGGADVVEIIFYSLTRCGPIPLAARGLPAVLARAGPQRGGPVDGGARNRRSSVDVRMTPTYE
jgi:hypothetical protein